MTFNFFARCLDSKCKQIVISADFIPKNPELPHFPYKKRADVRFRYHFTVACNGFYVK